MHRPVNETLLTNSRSLLASDIKESARLCSRMHFNHSYICVYSTCVCAPQLYTQLTVILDDPDFPRLTLGISQLSRSNLSLSPSVTHTADECIMRAETHRNAPMHITHVHALEKKKEK